MRDTTKLTNRQRSVKTQINFDTFQSLTRTNIQEPNQRLHAQYNRFKPSTITPPTSYNSIERKMTSSMMKLFLVVCLFAASANAGAFSRRSGPSSKKQPAFHLSVLPEVPAVDQVKTASRRGPVSFRRPKKQRVAGYSLEASLVAPEIPRGGAQVNNKHNNK